MVEVKRGEHESVERLISRFRQRVLKKGVLKQTRYQRFHHSKPSKLAQKLRAARRAQANAGQDELFLFEGQNQKQGFQKPGQPSRSGQAPRPGSGPAARSARPPRPRA